MPYSHNAASGNPDERSLSDARLLPAYCDAEWVTILNMFPLSFADTMVMTMLKSTNDRHQVLDCSSALPRDASDTVTTGTSRSLPATISRLPSITTVYILTVFPLATRLRACTVLVTRPIPERACYTPIYGVTRVRNRAESSWLGSYGSATCRGVNPCDTFRKYTRMRMLAFRIT